MIGTRLGRLNFSPALACVDCQQLTNQELIYQMSSLVWQILPLCDEHIEEPSGGDEPISVSALRSRINEQLAVIRQLRRKQQRVARAFLRLRNQDGHTKAKRALRWKLCRLCLHQAEAVEVWRD